MMKIGIQFLILTTLAALTPIGCAGNEGESVSVEEYAKAVCTDEEPDGDRTWGQMRVSAQESLDDWKRYNPPSGLQDYHRSIGQSTEIFLRVSEDKDQAAVVSILDFFSDERLMAILADSIAVGERMHPDIRRVMEEHGCSFNSGWGNDE